MVSDQQPRNALVFNMANEGIPMAAIARILGSTYDAVKELVLEAVDAGRLMKAPPFDWPRGEKLRALTSLDSMVEVQIQLKRLYKFPPKEAHICAMLMHFGELKRTDVARLRQHEDREHTNIDGKTMDVYISFLRKRLSTLDIHIETISGTGWALPFPEKQRLFDLLFGEGEEEYTDMDAEHPPATASMVGEAHEPFASRPNNV